MNFRRCAVFILIILLLTASCAPPLSDADKFSVAADDTWQIHVKKPDGEAVWSFTEQELRETLKTETENPELPPVPFAHIYSTINNWPSTRFYAAEGYPVAAILQAAGLYDDARTVTFRAQDGYEVSFTREQLFEPQFYFPKAGESGEDALRVYPVISFNWLEASENLDSLIGGSKKPCLIIGQRTYPEQSNPAFVESISEIIVDTAPCDTWSEASVFPLPGDIAAGETVKLQHPDYGRVKLYYTLDGSEPTALSALYNPSTYQPQLNVPITIIETTVIRVIACGYGKADSPVAEFEFTCIDGREG